LWKDRGVTATARRIFLFGLASRILKGQTADGSFQPADSDNERQRYKMDFPSRGQSFPEIRRRGLAYVDKTEYVHEIIRIGGCVFLPRPRRFGKSLLAGAMEEPFKGNRKAFEGLWIGASDYGFEEQAVVSLTMDGTFCSAGQL
jgi:hypothetical protein